jgi:hypothetical protein
MINRRYATPVVSLALAWLGIAQAAPLSGLLLQAHGRSDVPIVGSCSAPPNLVINTFTQDSYATGQLGVLAGASLLPMASVSARVTGNVLCPSLAGAFLTYNVMLTGAPNSHVPVDFSGALLARVPKFEVGVPGGSTTTTVQQSVGLGLGDSLGGSDMSTSLGFSASRFDSPSGGSDGGFGQAAVTTQIHGNPGSLYLRLDGLGTLGGAAGNVTDYDTGSVHGLLTNSFSGSFDGTFDVLLDASGAGLLEVNLSAFARADPLANVGDMLSFIDPYFRIDEAFLAAHPDSTLRILERVGNAAPGQVSEPPTWALLALPWLLRRRWRTNG